MEGACWLWLYRARAPGVRAQSIQTVHSAHAVARRGVRVTLAVNPSTPGVTAPEVLSWYGLHPHPNLDLRVLPWGGTAASLAWRALVLGWLLRHPRGVVYARDLRYARQVLRVAPRVRLFVEAHEVESAQAVERGEDPRRWQALEAAVLRRARGVVANAPGTLAVLRSAHAFPIDHATVSHNGAVSTSGSRNPPPVRRGHGVAYVGSLHRDKDLDTVARAAASEPITIVGGEGAEADRLVALSGGRLRIEPPVPHKLVPAVLDRYGVLLLALGDRLFGQQLASPLKLWDYLATGRPVVAADLPSIHAAAPGAFVPYTPGDPASLVRAIRAAPTAPLRPVRRTWDDRAAELVSFVEAA